MYYLAEKDDFNTLLQNKLEFVAEFRKKTLSLRGFLMTPT